MSSANLDLVRSIFADWERGDLSSVAWAHPEIEYAWVGYEPGEWTGLAEIAKALHSHLSDLEVARVTAEQYLELDDERVLVLFYVGGRGKGSGIELGQFARLLGKAAHLFHVRDGKVTRMVVYWDQRRAFADLGLTPED